MARTRTRNTAKPAAAAEPAAGAVAETRYYDPNVTWSAGAGEVDQPVPASGPPLDTRVSSGPPAEPGVDIPPPGHRDWAMTPAGMVPADRPAVSRGGEQPPAGGGQRSHDFVTSPGGPPVAAGEKTAAAGRPVMGTGVTNSTIPLAARPWDEEANPVTEPDHDVEGQPGLSGGTTSN